MPSAAFFRKLDDFLNPIAVKEMRQAVNGRFIAWTLLFFLIIQTGIAAGVLFSSESFRGVTGPRAFMMHLGVLLVACVFYLPISTAARFSSERAQNNVDLLFITALKPVQIIWGKILAAVILMVVFFSAALPFLTLTYLLRGLDIPSMFVLLAVDFCVVVICIQVAVFLVSIPASVMSRVLLFPIGLVLLGIILNITMMISSRSLLTGVGSSIGTSDFWMSSGIFSGMVLMILGLLFILSVALVTPRSANRALPIRIFLLVIWYLSGLIFVLISSLAHDYGVIIIWRMSMIILFTVSLFFSLFERDELGPRIIRNIPKRRILRFFAFFLYSGSASGTAFSLVMIAMTIISANLYFRFVLFKGDDESLQSLAFAVTAIAYALTALNIKRFFFRRSQRPTIGLEIVLILLIALNVIPLLVGYLLHPGPWYNLPFHLFIANPIIGFMVKKSLDYLYINAAWACIMVGIAVPWLFRKFRQFQSSVPARGLQPTMVIEGARGTK